MIDLAAFGAKEISIIFSQLIVGVVMVYYGYPKVKDLKKNAEDFVGMGFKPGWFWGTPIALLEFFGGIGMIIGIYPEIIAILFGVEMLVGTLWKVKVGKGFPHYSYDIILLALCLVIASHGAAIDIFR